MKLFRQYMVQETLYKCFNRQGGCFPSAFLFGVLEPEFDVTVFFCNDAVIAYGATVGIPANIFDDFLGSCKRRFGKDHPLSGDFVVQPLPEGVGICKLAHVSRELQHSFVMGFQEAFQKLGPEHVGQCHNWKKKGCGIIKGFPFAGRVDSPRCDNIVYMGMGPEFTSPDVQDAVKSDGGTQSFGIVSKIQERPGGTLKQQIIHHLSVIAAQGVELMSQGKDTMMVGYRQEVLEPCFHPLLPGNIIAAGTMAVPTGVVSFLQVAASVADLPVGTEFTAPAVFNVVHDLVLSGMKPVFGSPRSPVKLSSLPFETLCFKGVLNFLPRFIKLSCPPLGLTQTSTACP